MKIPFHSFRRQRGLTLIELMVALVLGLVVIGAVVNLFLTNRQTYRTTENLARMQENLRFAFELMARDVREAGATACGSSYIQNISNEIGNKISNWNWNAESLKAYAPGTPPPLFPPKNRATDSPVLSLLKGTDPLSETTVIAHDPENAILTLSSMDSISPDDIIFICLGDDAIIFQASDVDSGAKTVKHEARSNINPGNMTSCLAIQTFQSSNNACNKNFKGATILPLQLIHWYIGNNPRGGASLYRKVSNDAPVEMVPDIDQLTLSFLYTDINGSRYLPLDSVPDWTKVQAVRIMVRSVSTDKVGTDGQPLRREYPFTVALRNRLN